MKMKSLLGSRVATAPIPSTRWPTHSHNSSICICVVGVGFVGESLLTEFAKHFDTIGYDVSDLRVRSLQSKYSPARRITITKDPSHLSAGTHFLIAVPTPINPDTTPDLSCIVTALQTIKSYAGHGSCIIIESSVPVGTTRQLLAPYKDRFHGGMSPERIDPGRVSPSARQIPKVVSGLTPKALKHIATVYAAVYDTIVPVSRPEVAEMTKLYENCYRMVNIAYVNEVSDACKAHGIDPHEMIGAAATKPFGFQPFYPGLGVGGHCIPVNPFYLFQNNRRMKVLELATHLMLQRPIQQASKLYRLCMRRVFTGALGDQLPLPRILIVGLGFKPGQGGIEGSPAIAFANRLAELGCSRLAYHDPSLEKDHPWVEKIDPDYWTPAYIGINFDAVAVCNVQESIDLSILDGIQGILVKRYH